MRLFLILLLQALVFLPITGLAAGGGKATVIQNQKKQEVTEAQKAGLVKIYGKLPLYFIKNKGQVDGKVSFYERGAGHATFFTKDGVVIGLTKSEGKVERTKRHEAIKKDLKADKPAKTVTEALSLSFVGADKGVKITADERMAGTVNYFMGKDRSKWHSNIPTFGAVTYKDVYKNIDVKFYGNNRRLEHDVIVRPGGNISNVKFRYNGVQGLKVTKDGGLEVSLKEGKIIEQAPIIYQEIGGKRVAIEGSYRIFKSNKKTFEYGFDVASYDHTKGLVIDPVLVYSTYLGGSGIDVLRDIALDSSGNTYITGNTNSTDFPTMTPVQGANAGTDDVFVTKINPSGTALVYSTFLGGTGSDIGGGIAVDSIGNAYITGNTDSTDFPTMTPIQGANAGFADAFITKLNPAGTALVYSTYLGGTGFDTGNSIAVDSTGNAYVTGNTGSTDFPTMAPVQVANMGGDDAFMAKMNPAGTALVYSTYLGGSDTEFATAIAVDATGNAYVSGWTVSLDFPTMNPVQATHGGGFADAFVTKLNPAGSALAYSTYLGGSNNDFANDIAVDSAGSAYVVGNTSSLNFPVVNPAQATFAGGINDVFLTKFNPAGSALAYSTYLGGANDEFGNGIALDSSGHVFVTGSTNSQTFATVSPVQGVANIKGAAMTTDLANGPHTPAVPRTSDDAFWGRTSQQALGAIFLAYIGGSGDEGNVRVAANNSGETGIAGSTNSTDFPTKTPLQGTNAGLDDAFFIKTVVQVALTLTPDAAFVILGTTFGYTITATNNTASTQCVDIWDFLMLPNGKTYPPGSPLDGPVHACFPPKAIRSKHVTRLVPLAAPLGMYKLEFFEGKKFPDADSASVLDFEAVM